MNLADSPRIIHRAAVVARLALLVLVAIFIGAAGGCQMQNVQQGPRLDRAARWTLLPVLNNTEVPRAGERVESILGTLLRARGLENLAPYAAPADDAGLPELDERRRYEAVLNRARKEGYTYGVGGSVEEWRYRNGIDGEPAVGVTVQVVELASGKVVWSASGSRSGWGREVLSGTAQQLLSSMIGKMKF